MTTTSVLHIIKGAPCDKWEEVQAIQRDPFIYIMSCGSRWAGEEAGDIAELLNVLGKYRLDTKRFGHFYSLDPCSWAYNSKWTPGCGEPHYVDGERMYACDGVYRFFGNFEELSHVFNIDTNDPETIAALIAAIEANKSLPA